MLSFNLYAFLLTILMIVCSANAQQFGYNNYHPSHDYRAFSGRAFGEGVLRPGYDHGEGYLTEQDAPSFSEPNVDRTNYYG
ncbi:hypothetical protein ACLKA7_016878 [Drosophila subpalustris]